MGVLTPEGPHPFPFRIRSLSPPGPMVLHPQGCGRVGRCPHIFYSFLIISQQKFLSVFIPLKEMVRLDKALFIAVKIVRKFFCLSLDLV